MLRHTKLWLGVVVALASPAAALVPQIAVSATAPAVNWMQSTAQGPSARESSYMDYDSARHRTVLFGGVSQGPTTNTFFSDTWEYDGTGWTQIQVQVGPPAGALGQMVYDSARSVSILFGGGDNTGALAPITWGWNGAAWIPRPTAHTPPARVWFGMTYDSARSVTVMFGGSGQGGLLNDTWEYDGFDWRQVTTAHSPSIRYGHALAYDSGRGKTVLFGGHDFTTGRLNDTWEYNGSDWTQAAIANPPAARFLHSMGYDSVLGKVAMFGGDYFVPSVTLGPNNETWLYDGATWQLQSPASSPSPRVMAPVAYDSAHSSLVLFGGSTQVTPVSNFGDTWSLVVPQSTATFSATSLQFSPQPVLSTTSQSVTITDTGTAPLAIGSISAGGDFATADTCPRAPLTIAINGSCTITVSFTPTSGDVPRSGALTVTDNGPGGSQSIPLTGSGVWGQLTATMEPLAFGTLAINPSGTTAIAPETLTFPGAVTILTGFSADIPFFVNNLDCPIGAQLGAGVSCHIQVGFDPTTAGKFSGQVVIHDNEPGLRHPIAVSGTANPIPVAVTVNVTSNNPVPTFGSTLYVQALTTSTFGAATVTFNGHTFGPVDLGGFGMASFAIPLDDSTIPAGAGTYPLLVTVHPTDGVHSDSSVSRSVNVVPARVQTSWAGSALVVEGNVVTLSATLSRIPTSHPIWVRFDVTGAAGSTSTYFALVNSTGTGSVDVSGLAAGAYTVLAQLVASSGSASPNAYVSSDDLRAAFAVSPARGGYVAGAGRQSTTTVGFEFVPADVPAGSLAWIQVVQVTGLDGQPHMAYQIVTSTSATSLSSHDKTVTVTGQASAIFVDVATGVRYSNLDRSTAFQVMIAPDGSVLVLIDGSNVGLSAGSGVNHL